MTIKPAPIIRIPPVLPVAVSIRPGFFVVRVFHSQRFYLRDWT